MVHFHIFSFFLTLKLCSGLRYIDLKNDFISEGVEVQQGYFMTSGKYKMFHAQDPGLEVIQYGHIRVFPDMDYVPGTHSLYVELFKIADENVLSVYVFRISASASNIVYKVYFELSDFGYKLIDCSRFTELIKGKIHISLDLAKSKNHPFFNIHSKEENGSTTTLIEIRKSISGYRLRNVETKRYEFGRVTDSSFPIYMSHTKLKVFVTKATSIYVYKEPGKNYIVLRHWTKNIRFDFVILNGIPIWNAVIDPDPNLLEDHHLRVYRYKDKIEGYKNLVALSTLDLAENISPELLGIEKIMGKHGGAIYTLYHHDLRREVTNKIKYIIHSEMMDMVIAKIDERALYTKVEIIRNSHRTFVIVSSLLKINLQYETVMNYYDKPNMENTNFYHIPEPYQIKFISDMYYKHPVYIDLDLDDPPSIIDHGEFQYDSYLLKYYKIKEEDGRGSVLAGKYVIGDIWKRDLYETGNIPLEAIKKKYQIVAQSVNTDKIIIRPKNSDFPILPQEYESYMIIEC